MIITAKLCFEISINAWLVQEELKLSLPYQVEWKPQTFFLDILYNKIILIKLANLASLKNLFCDGSR